MAWRRRAALRGLMFGWCLLAPTMGVKASPPVTLKADGSLQIDGRTLKCGEVRNALDRHLPNLGISVPATRLLVINPLLLARESKTVRLFVFNHECGHHHVGGSELAADCWAVRRGVAEGWLDRGGIGEVCSSFGGAPETPTHPSAARRCGHLNRCFATAEAEKGAAARSQAMSASGTPAASSAPTPQLVSGPRLLRSGTLR
jgi:hypothetical protein